jgi:hypothetical protein
MQGLRERAMDAGYWVVGRVLLLVSRIDEDKITFEYRGVPVSDPETCERLENGARYFSRGFTAAMKDSHADRIAATLDRMDPDFRGFAFEGAGMAVSSLDGILRSRRRFPALLDGSGDRWSTLIYIGLGWTYARAGRIPERPPPGLDPVLGWLIFDGAGFHQGYLESERHVEQRERPSGLSAPALRHFDQGVGRSLLFVRGDNVEAVRDTIDSFPVERRADLWSGVGVASTYAGGLGEERLRTLREMARPYELQLAQGSAFAAMARVRADNVSAATVEAATVLCGAPVGEVAERAEAALQDLPMDAESPLEAWQARLREAFAPEHAGTGTSGGP